MNVARYPLETADGLTNFSFVSRGKKGEIHKVIQFQYTGDEDLYNLAFGDINPATRELDDSVVSDNGDTVKVLATVARALYVFFDHYPEATVYATGSTPTRIRLYRMGITKFYEEIERDFFLYGQAGNEFYPFRPGQVYDGFLAQRKFE